MLKISNIITALMILAVAESITDDQQKKADVHQTEIQYRDGIGLKYGQNTETITFAVNHQTDFLIKTSNEREQIKGTIHTYWRQQNIYISSEFREGQNLRLYIYEDNYNIMEDRKFYVTSGFKFNADKGKTYTLRIVDQGKINKLVAMQVSRSLSAFQNAATLEQYFQLATKIQRIAQEVKGLFSISEFGIIMQQKNSASANHSTCIYMAYLLIQALIVIVLVSLQVKYMTKLLNEDSVV